MDPMDTQLLADIIFIGICSIPIMTITVWAIYQLCVQDSSSWINKTYRNFTVFIMITFTFSTIGDLVHMILKYTYFPKRIMFDTTQNALAASIDLAYFIGNIAFYVLILLRITLPFELNKYVTYSLAFVIFLFGLAALRYIGYVFENKGSTDLAWTWITISLMILDLILSGFIYTIFVYKMKNTIINIDPSLSKAAEQNVNLMTNVITKHCVLFGSSLLVNQGFYAMLVVWNIGDNQGGNDPNHAILRIILAPFTVRTVENVTNVLILWLLLRINYHRYIKLCKCCHLCVGKCCFKIVDNETGVQNPYRELEEL